jgi:hypothetical protein
MYWKTDKLNSVPRLSINSKTALEMIEGSGRKTSEIGLREHKAIRLS